MKKIVEQEDTDLKFERFPKSTFKWDSKRT